MPGGSQRSKGRKNKIKDQPELRDNSTENENDNHSSEASLATGQKRHLSKSKSNEKELKIKKTKGEQGQATRSQDRDLSEEIKQALTDENDPSMDTAQFDEGDNMVIIAVRDKAREEFLSGSESDQSSDDDESDEEGEADRSMEDQSGDQSGNNNQSRRTDQQTDESEPEPDPSPMKRPKKKKNKKSKRNSMEATLADLSSTLKVMHGVMVKKGLFDDEQDKPVSPASTKRRDRNGELISVEESISDTTIYRAAVEMEDANVETTGNKDYDNEDRMIIDQEVSFKLNQSNRDSSSSDDQIEVDTSDEQINVNNFIADCEKEAKRKSVESENTTLKIPGGIQMVRESEASKARMVMTPGNNDLLTYPHDRQRQLDVDPRAHQASVVDENYMTIGGHVDEGLRKKIVNHEYVDFSKLVPRNRLSREDDHRMELISKGGATFFVPVADREGSSISSFTRWEQAFRVFVNIYTRAYPHKSTELIQYNDLIYTALLSFTWDNVYRYDKEFHLHLSNYPFRNWGVILQQAWTLYLKDRIVKNYENSKARQGVGKKICKRFNKGKCTSGFRCQFDHRCEGCGKFGHGIHICRSVKRNNQSPSPNSDNGNGENSGAARERSHSR